MTKLTGFPDLALYHYQSCPYCAWTRDSLSYWDLNVELRDIQKHQAFRKELIRGGGKPQVPCLRIEKDGEVSWLYESADITRYLQQISTANAESA